MHPERRKSERLKLKFCVRSLDIATSAELDCVTYDVSAGGLGTISSEQFGPGQSLDVWLMLPDNAEKIHTRGRVVWSRMVGFRRYRAGIELAKQDLNPTAMGLRVLRLKLKLLY